MLERRGLALAPTHVCGEALDAVGVVPLLAKLLAVDVPVGALAGPCSTNFGKTGRSAFNGIENLPSIHLKCSW